jgi:hypothetical protein
MNGFRGRQLMGWVAGAMIVGALVLGLPDRAPAQTPTGPQTPTGAEITADTIFEVRLADGSVFYGRIVAETESHLTLETAGGSRIELARTEIRSIRRTEGRFVDGQYLAADPNRTRLFFAPTGRPLARGQGYVANYMLFFPFVAYGVTDRISIAGGTPIFPEIIGEVFYLAPRATLYRREGIDLAAGALAFFATRELDEGSAGLIYGVGTFGDPDRALTAGAGWGFALTSEESTLSNDPVLMLGGEHRLGDRTKLITENWFVADSDAGGVFTAGIRLFGERLSGDLGLGFGGSWDDMVCCLPVLNFVYNFGGSR